MGFVFKFGSNWTNFDVSIIFQNARVGSVCARKLSEMVVSGPTSLPLTFMDLTPSERNVFLIDGRCDWSADAYRLVGGQLTPSTIDGCSP